MKLRSRTPASAQLLKHVLSETAPEDLPKELITTLRYDPDLAHQTRRVPIALEDTDDDVFLLGKLHLQKLQQGAKLLGWSAHVSHKSMVNAMIEAVDNYAKTNGAKTGEASANSLNADDTTKTTVGPLRIRVTLVESGDLIAEAFPTQTRDDIFRGLSSHARVQNGSDPVYDVRVDETPIKPSLATMIKTPNREIYNAVRTKFDVRPGEPKEILLIGDDGYLTEGTLSNVAFMRDNEWITPDLSNGGMYGVLRGFLLELGFIREGRVHVDDLRNGETVLIFNGVQGIVAGILAI